MAVGNIDEGTAAVECWQWHQFLLLALRAKQQAERGFDQFRHCATLTCSLALELGHDGVVNVERRLHMANMYHLFGYIAGLSPVSMAQLLVRSKRRLRMAQARGAAKEAAPEKELVRLR
jgi:hypothetical protein